MIRVDEILKKAVGLGACAKSGTATDWRSLVWLFFSPQGCEFCKEHNYPTIEMFRAMKKNVEPYNVHVEEDIKAVNEDEAIISGSADLTYHGTDRAFKVIIMHGAIVHLKVGNYAVVRVENMGGKLTIDNDGTAEVLL